jgi:hypothetical protein
VIAHLVEKNLNGGLLEEAVRKSVKLLMDDDSLAILSSNDPNKIPPSDGQRRAPDSAPRAARHMDRRHAKGNQ